MKPKLWSAERSAVRELFAKNPTHRGQLQALDLIAAWMAQASSNESAYRGAEEVARLARHGVTPLQILVEVCALSMWMSANPRAVPDDRSHDYALSHAVFRLAPRVRRSTWMPGTGKPRPVTAKQRSDSSYSPKARTSALAHVGRHLRVSYAALVANVQLSIASREAQQRAFAEAQAAPFSTL